MLILHGTWLPASGTDPARFVTWGESPDGTVRAPRRGRRSVAPQHPFAAPPDRLIAALGPLVGGDLPETVTAPAWLPSRAGAPLRSPEAGFETESDSAEPPQLTLWRLPLLAFPVDRIPDLLLALDTAESLPPELVRGDDLRFWTTATRFALELIVRQRLRPALRRSADVYLAGWRAVLDEDTDSGRFARLALALPPAGRTLVRQVECSVPAARDLLADYLDAVIDALARQVRPVAIGDPTTGKARGRPRRRSVAQAWVEALFGDPVIQADPAELAAFEKQYRAWAEAAGAPSAETFRVCLRLVPPATPEADAEAAGRSVRSEWTVDFLLQATDDPSLIVPAAEVWRQRGASAKLLNRRLDQPQERLLAGLGRAARICPPLERGLRTARPEGARLSMTEAYDLVREQAVLLRSSGFGVLVPGFETRIGARVRLGGSRTAPGKTTGPASFGREALIDYDWEIALGDETLSREEFEALARLKQPLVQVRGRWVELRPDQIEQALAFFRKQARGQMALHDALGLALAPNGQFGIPVVEVVADGWVDDLLGRLRNGGRSEPVEEPPGFAGRLRPYQKVGVGWLETLRRYGLGACLADDMGLGKTIQVIALLLHAKRRDPDAGSALLVCPTSVVGNWRRELERFAPSLRVLVHHGAGRAREDLAAEVAGHDLVISTYALLPRDESELASIAWSAVILDEAQNIKNAATKSAQVARQIPAGWRAALTGTPVENRLADLWSLFHFLNPGYLGSAEEFRRRFAQPIERARDSAATTRLKALTGPFILRRVKTDTSIIADLPEKNEQKIFCTLTREQATLYQAVVREDLESIEEAEGIQRRGQILATLTKLKQICNHPALFLHDGSALPGRSGKLSRLGEMLEEVVAVGDRALIFTQYAEIGRHLKAHLEALFGREVLFLHGGTRARERDRLVARFQSEGRGPQIFVLSIKAGGTGLNLTRANHVFHFDRWWNPAVENQATDRAFRIGQRRDVQVHKFVCAGTFEEVLDGLIERKVALAEAIVGTSEAWITELSTDQLRELFALRQEALDEE
ncbi:MAG TPA: DEAD/DEAH box helicase [Dehalococcoidia bacterium]|nr:DEAD/DEAH box helicase [Dehalococcoidia bacterium]